jgi:hypothetical protein
MAVLNWGQKIFGHFFLSHFLVVIFGILNIFSNIVIGNYFISCSSFQRELKVFIFLIV